jgi:hypothetical protein
MAITLNGTTGITTPTYGGSVPSEYITPVTSFKNRIINGAMTIDQRNAGASVTPVTGTYSVDRWVQILNQASKFSVQQNAGAITPPVGFTNYLGATSLSAYSVLTTDLFLIAQRIEGYNIADLNWGTADAKTVTISFWVRSSLTGTFGGALRNSDNSRSYPFTYTISVANTWEQKSITIAGETTGTWLTTNGIGVNLFFSLGVGSTYSGTAGAWAAANYVSATGATSVVGTNGATLYITGVQLEVGSTATSFDYRPYGTELVLAQRYCQAISGMSIGRVVTNATVGASFMSPVLFRTAPTASNITYTISTGATGTPATFGASINGLEFYNSASNWSTTALLQVSAILSAEL